MNRSVLYKYFANELSDNEMAQVRAWADSSEANRQKMIEARAGFDTMVLLGDMAVGQAEGGKGHKWLLRVAAVLFVAVVSSVATLLWMPRTESQMLSLTVPQGQRLELQLTDGTHVTLNGGTTLRYPAIFSRDKRHVEIDGEGYFEVAHDKSAPFTVSTYCGELRVLGTTFDVDAYSAEGTFTTSLFEGTVTVNAGHNDVVLSPGHKTVLAEDGTLSVQDITDYDEYSWRDGIICFNSQSIKTIMHKFEKHFGVKIILADDPKFDQAYTGKFFIADGVDYAIRVLRKDIEFEIDRDKDEHVITLR